MFKSSMFLCITILLVGCEHTSVSHQSPTGAITSADKTSFLIRSHQRLQTQQGAPNPIPPADPVIIAGTASNATGLEGVVGLAPRSRDNLFPNEAYQTVDGTGVASHDFFVYDNDVDPEPAVRVFRIGTVGVVASQIVGAAN